MHINIFESGDCSDHSGRGDNVVGDCSCFTKGIKGANSRETLLEQANVGGEFSTFVDPVLNDGPGKIRLAVFSGTGSFISARVTKVGGDDEHKTTIRLLVDGNTVINTSFKIAKAMGLAHNNPYGVIYSESAAGAETLTFGFPTPLYFASSLAILAFVQEEDVVKIFTSMVFAEDGVGEGTTPPNPEPDIP